MIFWNFFLKRNSTIVVLACIRIQSYFPSAIVNNLSLSALRKNPVCHLQESSMREKRKWMLFACHFYTFLHHWWSWNCCRECMNLKRNDSVVHVVFLRSKTELMAEISASIHLTVTIPFTFPDNTESLICFIFCWSLLRNVFTELNLSAFFFLLYHITET